MGAEKGPCLCSGFNPNPNPNPQPCPRSGNGCVALLDQIEELIVAMVTARLGREPTLLEVRAESWRPSTLLPPAAFNRLP